MFFFLVVCVGVLNRGLLSNLSCITEAHFKSGMNEVGPQRPEIIEGIRLRLGLPIIFITVTERICEI